MYPREQLKRCFKCKNNIKCWQLNEDIELGANEKEQHAVKIANEIRTQLIAQNKFKPHESGVWGKP